MLAKVANGDGIFWFGINTVKSSNSRPGRWEQARLGPPITYGRDRHTRIEPAALEVLFRCVVGCVALIEQFANFGVRGETPLVWRQSLSSAKVGALTLCCMLLLPLHPSKPTLLPVPLSNPGPPHHTGVSYGLARTQQPTGGFTTPHSHSPRTRQMQHSSSTWPT
jgi:hypothetical protein